MSTVDEQIEALKKGFKPAGTRRLEGKVAIVTGGSSGIGRAICTAYAREGAKAIIVADLQTTSTDSAQSDISTHDLITKAGGNAVFRELDVSKSDAFNALVDETAKEYGRLDVLVNNAGVAVSPDKGSERPIWEHTDAGYDLAMNVNARGVFNGTRAATKVMIEQEPWPSEDRGWIINISSIYGLRPFPKITAYAASKYACTAITQVAALDAAPYRVHVNAICPGYVSTPLSERAWANKDENIKKMINTLHPFKGVGTPEDVAPIAVMLASEDARWMTGNAIPVDGGYVCR